MLADAYDVLQKLGVNMRQGNPVDYVLKMLPEIDSNREEVDSKLQTAMGYGNSKLSITNNEELFGKQIYGSSQEIPDQDRLQVKIETLSSENLGL